jgi:hypothetical protein
MCDGQYHQASMISLFDTKSFGSTFVALIALGTTYEANGSNWALLILVPLSVAAGYWLLDLE